jgi:EAL domain-containing protein (putative c-di-GMP-specific phosphodiesterase class I)
MDESLVKALSLRESAGAIDQLVVAELANWLKANPGVWNSDPASFSINLSLGSLLDPEFSRYVAQCLQSSGVAPDTIGFEIQESAAIKHREDVARFIQECEKAGCYIVLDDFTMHSDAVPFLGSRAVRVVKVDPKLSTAAMHDRLAQAMVIAISQACKVLGLHCVAKRIDSTASRQWLAAVGIDFAQGYALEDPRPLQTLANPSGANQKSGVQRPASRS